MHHPKRLIILGSTGSIGTQTLEVVESLNAQVPGMFEVVGLAANRNAELLCEQAERFRVNQLALADEAVPCTHDARRGEGAAEQLVREVEADMVIAAIVGAAGIGATLAAIERGMTIALANKETLVAAGAIVVPEARKRGVAILPMDSEHSGVWQCLMGLASVGERMAPMAVSTDVRRVVLTASGGALREATKEQIENATPEQALAHPNWDMGAKVTIDTASLMNKALELLEAHWLFGLEPDRLGVLVHPQSIVHAMVETADGSVIAQLGDPDMRTPIQVALTHPQRLSGPSRRLDLASAMHLSFEPPDHDRFPALRLADEVMRAGGTAGAVFNAANERAVEHFLNRAITFGEITRLVERALADLPSTPVQSIKDVMRADEQARACLDAAIGC